MKSKCDNNGGISGIYILNQDGYWTECSPIGDSKKYLKNHDGSYQCTIDINLNTGKITGWNLIEDKNA